MVGNGEFLVDFATDRLPIIGAEDVVDSDIHTVVAVGESYPVARLLIAVVELFGNGMVGI